MGKTEFIKAVAEKADVTQVEAKKVIEAMLDTIAESLERGEEVQFVGFGSFKLAERAARTGRNPQTGEDIEIPASKFVTFKSGNLLKNRVNK